MTASRCMWLAVTLYTLAPSGELLAQRRGLGNWQAELDRLDQVAANVDRVGTKEQAELARLKSANHLFNVARLQPTEATPALTGNLVRRYREIINAEAASRTTVVEAANNLGVFYVTKGNYQSAVNTYKSMPVPSGNARVVYEFNYARALEGVGQNEEAFKRYLSSLQDRPRFSDAIQRAGDLAVHEQTGSVPKAVQLINQSLERGAIGAAGTVVLKALRRFGVRDRSLMAAFVEFCAHEVTSSQDIMGQGSGLLKEALAIRELRPLILELSKVYEDETVDYAAPEFYSSADHHRRLEQVLGRLGRFERMSSSDPMNPGPMRTALSKFYRSSAEYFRDQNIENAPHYAAHRYSAAWVLDLKAIESATQFMNILRNYEVPGGKETYENFLRTLFFVKGGIYEELQHGGREILGQQDWLNLYYLHWTLGDAFLAEADRNNDDPDSPLSALFQFSRAIWVGGIIRDRFVPDFPKQDALEEGKRKAMSGG